MSNTEQKKSFILFVDYGPQLQMLTDEQAGRLMKALFLREAALDRQEDVPAPVPQGEWTVGERMLYFTITKDLDRNRLRYRERVKANQENGRRGGRPKKAEASLSEERGSREEIPPEEAPSQEDAFFSQPPQPQEIRAEKPTGLFSKPKKPDTETDTETGTETDIVTEPPATTGLADEPEEEDAFASFWQMYPKKRNRREARREWDALGVTSDLWETMRKSLLLFLDSPDWQKEQGRFVPAPLQFLQDRRWEGVQLPPRDTGQQGGGKDSWWDKNQVSPASGSLFAPC